MQFSLYRHDRAWPIGVRWRAGMGVGGGLGSNRAAASWGKAGKPRVDVRRVISGILHVLEVGFAPPKRSQTSESGLFGSTPLAG